MKQNNLINIEVAFATPELQLIIPICVPECSSVSEVIIKSEIQLKFPDYDFSDINELNVGVFGKKIDINTYQLRENDRIEIYRKLNKTPNQKRLERAKLYDKK